MLFDSAPTALTVLLSSVAPSPAMEVWACRELAARTPGYRSRLAGALLRLERVTDTAPARLRASAEAVQTARQIDPVQDHHATDLLFWALHAQQRNLDALGRTAEARAVRREILALVPPLPHTADGCAVTDCYAEKQLPPLAAWRAEAATAS